MKIIRYAMLGLTLLGCFTAMAQTRAFISLDTVTLDKSALENGCSPASITTGTVEDCQYRVCFNLVKSLWLNAEAERRNLNPDAESMEMQQRDYEKSDVGSNLNFNVRPRIKFQRQAIEMYRHKRADDPKYDFASLWKDVQTSAAEVEIPERALKALVTTYGEDEQRFLEFQKMFPDDHESAQTRSQNNWDREARRVAVEKSICPDDSLTTEELTRARVQWESEMTLAPEATAKMLSDRKRTFFVNAFFVKKLQESAQFADVKFKNGLVNWVQHRLLDPDKPVFQP